MLVLLEYKNPMLEILLIRHGQTDWNLNGRIMGYRPIPLNAVGRRQSEALRGVLGPLRLKAIYTSPILRAVETARLMAKGRRVRILKAPEVREIEYGDWVGRTFEEVSKERNYRIYHTTPRHACAPGGERMTEVHKRVVGFIEKLRKRHREGRIAVVSHADVIKVILVHYLNLDLNELLRIRIDNGALSSLSFNGSQTRVLGVNCHPTLQNLFLRTDQNLPSPGKR